MTSRRLKAAKQISLAAFWVLAVASAAILQGNDWLLGAAPATGAALAFAGYVIFLRLGQAQAQRELAAFMQRGGAWTDRPVVLFLRSFAVARSTLGHRLIGVVAAFTGGGGRFDVEEKLDDAVGANAMLVAIGDKHVSYGSAKLTVGDSEWQDMFRRLADSALLIVMMPGPSEAVLWELAQILGSPPLAAKTVFAMPRASDQGTSETRAWAQFANAVDRTLRVRFPAYQALGCYLRLRPAERSWDSAHLEPFTREVARAFRQGASDIDVAALFARAA